MNTNRIFYISSQNGSDTNPGDAPDRAFRSLAMAGSINLQPGDQLLLERGSVFQGEALHLTARGTADAPILVDAYGEGPLPAIHAAGSGLWYQNYGGHLDNVVHTWKGYVSSAVLLYDAEYITLRNLEITNHPQLPGERYNQGDRMNRTGVSVIARDCGTLHQIELDHLYIHYVEGNVYDKHLNNGGIYMSVSRPEDEEKTGIARFDGVHIHHCRIEDCRRWGMAVGYTYQHDKFTTLELPDEVVKKYGSENVLIEHNFLRNIGGDGITPMYCFRPLVQYNVSENIALDMNRDVYTEPGDRQGMTAAAMWPWKCKTAIFQFNEAYSTFFNQDGEAWDADSGDGTIYQYNYSHDNAGGCIMFCEGESVNNIFRYNLSVNDGTGTITPVRNVDAHIYNNTFYIPEGVPFIRPGMSEGGILVENNIFLYAGREPKQEEWHHQTEKAVYRNNLYCNYQNVPREDDQAIIVDSASEVIVKPGSGPVRAGEETNSREEKTTVFDGCRLCKDSPARGRGKTIENNGGKDFFGNPLGEKKDLGAC
ncbi:MAG: polyhydroxyalkanoate depolymerase [Clostridiales bacterium]|nr:polyhydroxyalkanoate depolymerase [Clostridiales bacterium]